MPVRTLIADHLSGAPRGTAAALARALGVSHPTVTRWRDGDIVPEEWRAPDIARELCLPVDAVLQAIVAGNLERQTEAPGNIKDLREEVARLRAAIEEGWGKRGNEPR